MKEIRDFVHRKVFTDKKNYARDTDLVMVVGDFNMNGAELT